MSLSGGAAEVVPVLGDGVTGDGEDEAEDEQTRHGGLSGKESLAGSNRWHSMVA
jgi:hypothetical protein